MKRTAGPGCNTKLITGKYVNFHVLQKTSNESFSRYNFKLDDHHLVSLVQCTTKELTIVIQAGLRVNQNSLKIGLVFWLK